MIKWIYKPGGHCPVQAEGYFLGYYFYFRSRWDKATIEFAKSEDDWNKDIIMRRYLLWKTADYEAGYLNYNFSKLLIYFGCFKFFLNGHKKEKSLQEL